MTFILIVLRNFKMQTLERLMRLNFKIKPLIIFICFSLTAPILPQSVGDTINYFFESNAVTSSDGNAPFWFVSNNFGTISLKSPSISARFGLNGNLDLNKTLRILYVIDIIDRYSNQNELFIQQAYAGLKLGFFTLMAGSWEENYGNQDNSISSGGVIWSGNARPIPQISFATSGYIPVPFTKDFVELKGGISHGWFEDNQYNSDVWLHHKYLYLKFGGEQRVHLEYGLHHCAQWGGKSSNPDYGELPDDIKAFGKVFLGRGGGDDGPEEETSNVIGNHIGSHNLALDFNGQSLSLKFNWQTIFEDGSGLRLRNIKDGLWGIRISSESWKYVSDFLVEFINTTDQSGRFHDHYEDGVLIIDGGNDNYFNHIVYREGWTYNGMTIGTPLITSPALIPSSNYDYIPNNKTTTFHFGMEGRMKNVNYKALYTYSRNYGTNANPFPARKDQHSLLLKSTFTNLLPWDISMTVAVAADLGELFQKNAGIMLSFRKEGFVKWKSKNDN